ncbi:GGDEF domain-containing protein [Phytopseudomonas dryadis]|uniref:GGDEF domain-containing protein n=1 Tax=Phytopseudomonas dryadis TaxID=2487520 RepID=A0A4V2KCU8_9GAMM|nr:diguanylate cyclase [Pseudomonas dryadis]TBU96387.1 hypothetical protein DNK44_04350 [Pseudomonas dryadis]
MTDSPHLPTYVRRIVYLLLAALLAIQVIVYQVGLRSHRALAEETLRGQLDSTAQVFEQLLELRHRQLAQSAAVLASDYGFKEAIAVGERATVESMLEQHGHGIQADIALLNTRDRQLIASVPSELQQVDVAALLKAAAQAGGSDQPLRIEMLRSQGGALYQLIHSVVNMPTPQADLTLGFAIDDAFAEHLKRITGSEFVFLSRGENGAWQLHGSTLDSPLAQLLSNPAALLDGTFWSLPDADSDHLMRSTILEHADALGASEVLVLMGKSLRQAMTPYAGIERLQRYLIGASLLLAALAALLVTRRLPWPRSAVARQDPLTGLPDRHVLDQRIERALNGQRHDSFVLMMIDLDQVKRLDDRYGRAAGDTVLKVTAQRLRRLLRRIDTPVRLGDDQFAVLLPGIDRATAIRLSDRIEQRLGAPIAFQQHRLRVDVGIGIAVAPEDGDNASELLRVAAEEMSADQAQRLDGTS